MTSNQPNEPNKPVQSPHTAVTKRSLSTQLKHLWLDHKDARSAVPLDMAARLQASIAASEMQHSGEIRIVVEGSLPRSYLRRDASSRERAEMLFAKLGIWNTDARNGVLIYLLLADHAIEIVADRGLANLVDQAEWDAMVQHLSTSLKLGDVETGLQNALMEVSTYLSKHFALKDARLANPNELSDLVICI